MQIVNLMTPDPIFVGPYDKLADAKRIMDEGGFRRVPVLEGDKVIGMLTERDIRGHAGYLEATCVDAAMRSPVITVAPYNTAKDAAALMLKYKIGGMPVIASGEMVGIVTTSDLLKAFLAEGQSVFGGPRLLAKPKPAPRLLPKISGRLQKIFK